MAIKAGDRMPNGVFAVMTDSGPGAMSTDELFKGKRVVLVSVPGAFTPTCSMNHLPGFVQHADEIKAKGVDTIACMAVNDVFVMDAWGKDRNVNGKVLMLADGNGEYTRALGLEMDGTKFCLGMRVQGFALVVNVGVLEHAAVEEPGNFEVSKAEAILDAL